MTDQKKNYTDAQALELRTAYEAADSQETRDTVVAQFAADFGKNAASIRAKLVSEGVYIAKTYATKKGEKPESKANIVGDIAEFLGVNVEAVESLEKANKKALDLIRGTLARVPTE